MTGASGPGGPAASRRAVLAAVAGGVLGGASVRRARAHTEVTETVPTLEAPDYPGDTVDASGDFPWGADELVVFCGGYGTNEATWDPEGQALTAAHALAADADRPTTVVAYDYALLGNYWQARYLAGELGAALAAWLDAYAEYYPGTTLRLLGHSLGAQVVVQCLDALTGQVATADSLLGGVGTTAVTADGAYYDAIREGCGAFRSFYDREDLVAPGWALVEFEHPIASHPAEGLEAPNYADVDVTDDVLNHLSAFAPGAGCMDVVAGEWAATED